MPAGGIASGRLSQERKNWRKDHPIGFYARPTSRTDGSSDLFRWETGIPGKDGTDWEGGVYKVILKFSKEYPSKAPDCSFSPPIFHPNVYTNGNICLSILTSDWRPAITVKQILMGIQDLLDTPNPKSPANDQANRLFVKDKAGYSKRIRQEANKHKPISL